LGTGTTTVIVNCDTDKPEMLEDVESNADVTTEVCNEIENCATDELSTGGKTTLLDAGSCVCTEAGSDVEARGAGYTCIEEVGCGG
jgi:hypothetical protein